MRKGLAPLLFVLIVTCCGSHLSLQQIRPSRTIPGALERVDQRRLAARIPLSVDFDTPSHGLLSTAGGVLYETGDGGTSWQRLRSSGAPVLLNLVSRMDGFALATRCRQQRCVAALVSTLNGGHSWRRGAVFERYRNGYGPATNDLDFVDSRHGWRARWNSGDGRNAAWRTSDGGRSWRALRVPCPEFLAGLSFVDRQRGFLACGGVPATIDEPKELYVTDDGGSTWRIRERSKFEGARTFGGTIPLTGHAAGIEFHSASDGFLLADRVGLYRTRDGGHHWHTSLFTDDTESVFETSSPSARRAYAVASRSGLLRSDDGGAHWRQLFPHPPGLPQGPVVFESPRRGLGAGTAGLTADAGAVLATADGGRSWRVRSRLRHRAIQQLVLAGTDVWAVAAARRPDGTTGTARLYRSTDNGHTWRPMPTPVPTMFPRLSFPTARSGLFAYDGGLFRTTNGGKRWQRVSRRNLSNARFATPKIGLASSLLADRNKLFSTTDGGAHWHHSSLPPGTTISAVAILDERHWWLAGSSQVRSRGMLLRTSDAGHHWDTIHFPSVPSFQVLTFSTPSDGFAGDATNGFYRTHDGGTTWTYVYPRAD
ncbi:MAG: WD40/YVTN/BNR-like repeat-containing protein [Gaiellaceae bacterium]